MQHFLTISLLAATGLASAIPSYQWSVTEWQAGLTHSNPALPRNGSYRFDLSAPEYQGEGGQATFSIPGFAAHCEGRALGVPADRLSSDWADCSMTEGGEEGLVAARVYPVDGELLCHVAMSFSYELGGQRWNITTNVTREWAGRRRPESFEITDLEAAEV